MKKSRKERGALARLRLTDLVFELTKREQMYDEEGRLYCSLPGHTTSPTIRRQVQFVIVARSAALVS
jgi:hypothetical protein